MSDKSVRLRIASKRERPIKKARPAVDTRDANGHAEDRLESILQVLQEDIIEGRLVPGQRLDERTLATRFGLSRTPIREILVRLSSLGIVSLRRNQGAFVTRISSARLIGMLEVMSELKVLAARQAARRMNAEERKRLGVLKDRMAECAEKNAIAPYFEAATALHDAVCEGAHNPFLLETTRNIQICLNAYRRHLSRILHRPIRTSLEENCRIVDALIGGDSQEAERWMRQQTELRREEFADLISLVSETSVAANGTA
jgi:DNA-binding GntR family transcriptional regulator